MTEAQTQAKEDEIANAASCEEKLSLALDLIGNLKRLLKDCYDKESTGPTETPGDGPGVG